MNRITAQIQRAYQEPVFTLESGEVVGLVEYLNRIGAAIGETPPPVALTPTWVSELATFVPGTNTATIAGTPESLNQCLVIVGGQKIPNAHLSLNGNTFTFSNITLPAGEVVEVHYVKYTSA